MGTLFKLLLILLVLANLAVAAVWLGLDQGLSARFLPPPPPTRVDLGPWPLAESETAAPADQADEEAAAMPDVEGAPSADPAPISTTDSSSEAAPAQPAPQTPTDAPPPPSQVLDCVVLGPFASAEAAAAAAARITAAGGQAAVEQEPASASTHLVYVEPASSEQAAVAILEALAAQSIDAYVIRSGARRNGVSVGVFSKRELAEAQRSRVAALGFEVAVHPPDEGAAHHVVASQAPADSLGDAPQAPCR